MFWFLIVCLIFVFYPLMAGITSEFLDKKYYSGENMPWELVSALWPISFPAILGSRIATGMTRYLNKCFGGEE